MSVHRCYEGTRQRKNRRRHAGDREHHAATFVLLVREEGLGIDAGTERTAGSGQNNTRNGRSSSQPREHSSEFLDHRMIECIYRRSRQTDHSYPGPFIDCDHRLDLSIAVIKRCTDISRKMERSAMPIRTINATPLPLHIVLLAQMVADL